MFAFPRIAGRFGTERLVVVGSLAFALRALLAALAVDPVALVLIAPLEGIGFASVFVGGVTVLAAHAPASLQGTAQGLFAGCAGLATIIGSFAGGEIAGALSIPGLFLVGAGGQPGRDRDRRDRAPRVPAPAGSRDRSVTWTRPEETGRADRAERRRLANGAGNPAEAGGVWRTTPPHRDRGGPPCATFDRPHPF